MLSTVVLSNENQTCRGWEAHTSTGGGGCHAQKFGQIHNSVAGDVHVRGYYPGFAARFFEENEINLEMMPEDDEILKNGTVDFVSISYYSGNCVSVTQKGEITAANGGENIKNPYLETSAWGWQIDVLLVQKSH